MRKYFTWRCVGLHVAVIVLVPTFLLLGRWQYHAAVGGNDLSWAYTVEWPVFAVYAVYMWWMMIHEQRTPFDRLWAAKARAAAEASSTPLHQIPGWALDKPLARAVAEASRRPSGTLVLPSAEPVQALESSEQKLAAAERARSGTGDGTDGDGHDRTGAPVDARVVEVRDAEEDGELAAYNRYLARLHWSDPPKRW